MTVKEKTAIAVRGLAKRFGDVVAVAGINFDMHWIVVGWPMSGTQLWGLFQGHETKAYARRRSRFALEAPRLPRHALAR